MLHILFPYINFFFLLIIFLNLNTSSFLLVKSNKMIFMVIKHNDNKVTLISRNYGALISKGEYLIFLDPDDILTQDILNTCYQVQK